MFRFSPTLITGMTDDPTFDFSLGFIPEENGGEDDRHTIVANHINGMSKPESDGMLSHENEEMKERVIALEKKVHEQEDELLCLKSALSDVIRRLSAVEANRPFQNNVLPSKPNFRGPPQRRGPTQSSSSPKQLVPMMASRGRTGSLEAVGGSSQRGTSPTPSKIVPRRSPTSPKSLRKWPSVPSGSSSSEVTTPNGPLTPTSPFELSSPSGWRHSNSLSSLPQTPGRSPLLRQGREPSFCQDDGSLKFYLRGRPVNLYAPTTLLDYDVSKIGQTPDEHLKLEWVYGYRGRDARCNIYQLPTGEMVYFIASAVILYNVEEQMQRHYLGHTDDVKCIAIHPDKITIATGQVAGHDKREGKRRWRGSEILESGENWPHIRIWDSVSLNTLKVIGIGEFERAVACIGFSKSDGGLHLVAIDDGNEHTISVWEWQKGERGHKVTETKSSTEPVLVAEFHPCENSSIVTCGKNQISFWTLDGGTLTRKLGVYEKHDKPKFVTCLAFAENGDVLTGDSNGSLFVWGRATNRVMDAIVGAHEGTIFSICVLKDGTLLTGGKDRKIVHWGLSYKRMGVEQEIPEQYGAPRMLSQGKGNMILVGTTRNRILQGALGLEFSPIVQGHVDELWGLACHPSQHQFVTCGYDTNLYVWDTLTHSAIWCVDMMEGCHCVAFHPEGNIIAVGCLAAKWLVIDIITRDIISTHIDGMERVECIAYSPDGQSLAIGSRDNNVYLYSVSDGGRKYSRRGRCSGHSSFVTHIDWSVDSQFLQSNSGDYELLFWNAATCHQLTSPSSMRDTEWASHSCTLGFNVCGVWPEGADGTDVNACCRSNTQNLVASADDFGKVNLYSYPCCQPRSQCHTYGGHSSHVTNVAFLCDDTRLLSTGGKDMAVLQWQIL